MFGLMVLLWTSQHFKVQPSFGMREQTPKDALQFLLVSYPYILSIAFLPFVTLGAKWLLPLDPGGNDFGQQLNPIGSDRSPWAAKEYVYWVLLGIRKHFCGKKSFSIFPRDTLHIINGRSISQLKLQYIFFVIQCIRPHLAGPFALTSYVLRDHPEMSTFPAYPIRIFTISQLFLYFILYLCLVFLERAGLRSRN